MEPDIAEFENQLAAIEIEAQTLAGGLTEAEGTAVPPAISARQIQSWSVANCLDHIGITNDGYLARMRPAAEAARAKNRMRRGAARPGIFGRYFASLLEPPVKRGRGMKAPASIHPTLGISMAESLAHFIRSHRELREFVHANADLDLAGVMFLNPFVPGLRFSLATGICNLLAHERRHLWQARQVVLALGQPQ